MSLDPGRDVVPSTTRVLTGGKWWEAHISYGSRFAQFDRDKDRMTVSESDVVTVEKGLVEVTRELPEGPG